MTAVDFRIRDSDGKVRGVDHGKNNGEIVDAETYRKAQVDAPVPAREGGQRSPIALRVL